MTDDVFTFAEQEHATPTAGDHSAALWQDPGIWVSAAFLVVVVLLLRLGAHRSIVSALDKRSQKIADDLNEARRLREQAQEILAQYQRQQRDAEQEAKEIIEEARREAKRIEAASRTKIAEQIERRAKTAEEKIARAEAQAIAEVRAQAADLAVEAAREIIRTRMDKGAHAALVEKAIAGLRAAAS